MTMYAIDTLAFAKRMRAAGMSQDLAEAIAEAHGQAFREAAEHTLATKHDLAEVRTELKHDLAEVRTELKQDIAEVRTELKQDIAEVRTELVEVKSELKQDITSVIKWNVGTMVACAGIILAAIRLLA